MAIINEKIYIGSVDTPTLSFNQNNIEDIICNNSVNLIGDELASDVLEVSVFFDDTDKVLENVAYATPIFYFSNDALVGKYYINQIERKGIKKYLVRATSLIGLIEKENFYGEFCTGKAFKDVVDDILFTNGINITKYKLYQALTHPEYALSTGSTAGTKYTQPVQVAFAEQSVNFWKYRMHLEFTYLGENRSVSGNSYSVIAGRDYKYYIQATSSQTSLGNWYLRELSVWYNGRGYSLSNIPGGIGSKFLVDVDPVAGTAFISTDYTDPDDSTVTGHLERYVDTITVSTSTSPFLLNYAYGGANNDTGTTPCRYSMNLAWDKFRLYNENGDIVIDAMFGTNESGTINYVANAATGYVVSTTAFNPYGTSYATVADFSRIERDQALAESIIYNGSVEDIPVTGWIKNSTRREALHQLLFAENVSMLKSGDGKTLFTKISGNKDSDISDDDLYDDSSEKSISAAKKINITEHSYETNNVTSEKIFDNSSSATPSGEYIALFDKAPIFGTPVGSGINIIAHNCNAALVTGKGTITGTPYVHSKNVIQYVSDSTDGVDVSINDVGLITSINSDSVMSKLKAYYSGSLKKIINSIIFNGERCGLKYAFKSMFSNSNTAHLTKLKAQTSSFVKAQCEFISGFIPQSSSGYTDFEIVTLDTTWTVPSDVRSQEYPTIRLNIIGKGSNGTAGSNGTSGSRGSSGEGALPGGAGGTGGAAGVGGSGGNIYSITIDVTNVNSVAVSGSGSNTVLRTYNDGGTLLNTYSSSSGISSDSGFMNVFTGVYYARKGRDGIPGGDGGQGGYVTTTTSGVKTVKGASGGNAGDYIGGESFGCITRTQSAEFGTATYFNSYGGGGGAAYGNNGGNAYVWNDLGDVTVETKGGNGANAIAPQNVYTEYGSGGFGGNGGGGGGGAGTVTSQFPTESSGYEYYTGYYTGGTYGTGSAGTQGINGCAIIYY